GTFELVERKEKIIGDPRGNGIIKLPPEKTIKFRASPNLNKLFNKEK
ncbi:HU family DNA-binding protein, partial [uncultured Fusobacterium sp.]